MPETLLFIQSGDYREAFRRFAEGGAETYLEQRNSVEFVRRLSEDRQVAVAAVSNEPYDEHLTPSLRAIGIREDVFYKPSVGRELFERVRPTVAVPRVPQPGLLAALGEARVSTMPLFADIYQPASSERTPRAIAHRWRLNRRVRKLLDRLNPVAVCNHTFNASVSLAAVLGLSEEIVVPWEWTPLEADPLPRIYPENEEIQLFFAGVVSSDKGVGDLICAVEILAREGRAVKLDIAGPGTQVERFREEVAQKGLSDRIAFLGRVPHEIVTARMREVHAVIVPSRHAYPEGLPNVVFETLAARTPLVASDHPSWVGRLRGGQDCAIFRQKNPQSLADTLIQVVDNSALWTRLSKNGSGALASLYVGTLWYDLIRSFLADPVNATGWRDRATLAAMRTAQPFLFR